MSRGSQKAYESARDDMVRRRQVSDQRKEERREQKEEQKKQRLEKKVSGVGADLLIPKNEGNGLQEVAAEPETQEMPAIPENACMPEETIIGFDEDDLLKNALSRKELEAEKAQEAKARADAEVKMPTNESLQPEAPAYQFPPLSLLKAPDKGNQPKEGKAWLQETAGQLQQIMEDFGVNATVTNVSRGPAVTPLRSTAGSWC